jgi:hypothetical protein
LLHSGSLLRGMCFALPYRPPDLEPRIHIFTVFIHRYLTSADAAILRREPSSVSPSEMSESDSARTNNFHLN